MLSTHRLARTVGVAGLVISAGVLTQAAPASASEQHHGEDAPGVVFVQNDALDGNEVAAYRRGDDGTLSRVASYPTGGKGGRLEGAVVDVTASQGSLTADRDHGRLYAVNAGSDTVSVFAVHGDRLRLRQVVGSGGSFPVSVAAQDDRVFVLNARAGGSLQGFARVGGRLVEVPAWHRELNLPVTTGPTEFTHTPGQVAFTADGRHLVVTTKAATSSILVYTLRRSGALAKDPVVTTEPGTVPFGVDVDAAGHLQVAVAGANAVHAYDVGPEGALTRLGVTALNQAATCWITAEGDLLAASNAGAGTVTTLLARPDGPAARITDTPTSAGGTVDADFTPDGRYLYVQVGSTGSVDAFAVRPDGTLVLRGSVTVPDAVGGEGIVAW